MVEEWRVYAHCEYYEVSNLGNVRSWKYTGPSRAVFRATPKLLTVKLDKDGYPVVKLRIDNKAKMEKVHRMVCMAWHGLPPRNDLETRHLDGDKTNNTPSNLAWGTAKENSDDRGVHGTRAKGSRIANSKLTEEEAQYIRESTEPYKHLQSLFGVSKNTIWRIRAGLTWAELPKLSKEQKKRIQEKRDGK